ncbi:MAG TPA: hypothetical protein VGB52_03545 [Actinomycetota bacterium]
MAPISRPSSLEGIRPLLAVVISMTLVMGGILIGSRLPGRDVTLRYPTGFALDYAGAPADSFVPLTADGLSRGSDLTPHGSGSADDVLTGDGRAFQGPDPECRDNPYDLRPRPCEATSQSVEYVATPGGLGVNYEDSPASVGGQIFQVPSTLRSIRVEDDNGPGVSVFVCQRYVADGRGDICTSGDVELRFCSAAGPLDVSGEGFRPGYFRIRVDTASPTCPTAGTTGTITITW